MDKIFISSKIINIFKEEEYPTIEERIAYITALGNIGNKESFEEIIRVYEKSKKDSAIRIATILSIAKFSD
ncbi:HEAT repeat domain-containing protein [Pectobacterium carotovorum]|uniref:HEAT repeat domain-containing protein n=1 Tax=Pectobacterium polonicum TaxID=2485124 RepID=A0ABV1PC43_9GAMM|nr:HEAT repeat domain-containing protein [Pectobacterium polonicum]MDC9820884.1 HEAT repeat domain-containing protein [Pectobacterium polonicum]